MGKLRNSSNTIFHSSKYAKMPILHKINFHALYLHDNLWCAKINGLKLINNNS